jgi:hypothetical protein
VTSERHRIYEEDHLVALFVTLPDTDQAQQVVGLRVPVVIEDRIGQDVVGRIEPAFVNQPVPLLEIDPIVAEKCRVQARQSASDGAFRRCSWTAA